MTWVASSAGGASSARVDAATPRHRTSVIVNLVTQWKSATTSTHGSSRNPAQSHRYRFASAVAP